MAFKISENHSSHNHRVNDCCSNKNNHEQQTLHDIQENEHEHGNNHNHNHSANVSTKEFFPAIISFALLIIGLLIEHIFKLAYFEGWIKFLYYLIAYLPVGLPVIKAGYKNIVKGEVFTEFFLMSVATIGAFAIKEYPEGVAVMLFYTVGELFQSIAVNRSKSNIKSLLDVRPKIAHVQRNGQFVEVEPDTVKVGEIIQVRVGEKIPLDGVLMSNRTSINTAALTGESRPQFVVKGETVLAGSINMDNVIEVKTSSLFNNSSIARILELVQNATARKSKTELLIRRLAKIYTPIVTYLALALCFLPYLFVENYVFSDWLYRALVFLVISCPCALVVSIPLGYFGGLGAASKNGILLKGATYLDQLTKIKTLVIDKTGTLTKGIFEIKEIKTFHDISKDDFMRILLAIESKSTHPIAKALLRYNESWTNLPKPSNIKEYAGKGLSATINGQFVVVGNYKLMEDFEVLVPTEAKEIVESIVLVSIDNEFAGYVTIADELKEDALEGIRYLRQVGIKEIIMLSGDKDSITQKVATELSLDKAKGGLLPEDKLFEVEKIKVKESKKVAFVGDGINDAPVIAASDVGIAMGGLGSDLSIETADVIIQTDEPSKIATGISIGKSTQKIIWQNIILALGVKIIVLIAGALGLASMWLAVFADVGVAMLAILNAIRLQRMNWK